jgi:biotin carboxyl carrier protein
VAEGKTYIVSVAGEDYRVEITPADGGCLVRVGEGKAQRAELARVTETHYSLLLDSRSYHGILERHGDARRITVGGKSAEVRVQDARMSGLGRGSGRAAAGREDSFKTPMPGLVVAVAVSPGDTVSQGQPLVTLESMKMSNDLKSPCTGLVKEVLVLTGQTVAKGDVLIRFEG